MQICYSRRQHFRQKNYSEWMDPQRKELFLVGLLRVGDYVSRGMGYKDGILWLQIDKCWTHFGHALVDLGYPLVDFGHAMVNFGHAVT